MIEHEFRFAFDFEELLVTVVGQLVLGEVLSLNHLLCPIDVLPTIEGVLGGSFGAVVHN